MAGHGTKLGRKQEDAIAALLSQRNVDDAARAAGVGARTLWRWLQDPKFQAVYRKAKRAVFGQSIARLQQASSAAVAVVLKVMLEPTTPASTRLRAADIVLARSAKAIELEDLEARLSELEHAARKRRSKAVDGRDAVSAPMSQPRQLEGRSRDIRPAPKVTPEHRIALPCLPKVISESQK